MSGRRGAVADDERTEICQKERERQRAPVARTQRVLEARPVCRCRHVTEIHGVLVDQYLVTRARRAAAVSVRGRRDPEARINLFQISVDALTVVSNSICRSLSVLFVAKCDYVRSEIVALQIPKR